MINSVIAKLWTSFVAPELLKVAETLEADAQTEITALIAKLDTWIQTKI